ncbi:cytochrome c [Colwellia hornerae]|uniref:C-type cytochrome n=1 Tax=Colwellia hornerae TaxID=89402 RepID=A0A5C6QNP5_9GAMM|nr:cytochrome c [Colwellia hornerae]TWX54640.1 c-type cytochrome [Colwellia hornerae]TWX61080.1 c-type cytochrome [Colwellia hornerae]TWX70333.1 c-type cytochrome [Colwellia hornerae]
MKLVQLLLPFIIVTSIGASSISAFSVQAQHVSDPSLVAQGAKIFSENCGRCHNARPAEEYSKMEWSVVIPHMRAKAHMTGKEALAVEAFLGSTLTSDIRNTVSHEKSDAPKRTGAVLVAQFGCQGCHQIKGEGGTLGPALDDVISNKGEAFVLKKLANPKFNNAASAMPKYPINKEDMKAIVAFLKH